MSLGEWSQKAKLQLVLHKGDNDRKHYLLSGQFWEHFQLLKEKTFVKLETLACWHWQRIHNAHVNLLEGSRLMQQRQAETQFEKALIKGRKVWRVLLQTIKMCFFSPVSWICRYKENKWHFRLFLPSTHHYLVFYLGVSPFILNFIFLSVEEKLNQVILNNKF